MITTQLKELILQSLQHEQGGVLVYQTALECVVNEDLREEWTNYLEQTNRHVDILTRVCLSLDIDPREVTPGRKIVHHTGKSLVMAMKLALAEGDPAAAELVACDTVVLAETKDHANWQLLRQCALLQSGEVGKVLKGACDTVEDEEDEHLYHTKGWCRELWFQSLGMPTVLPPPEEAEHVKSAVAAAKAMQKSIAERRA